MRSRVSLTIVVLFVAIAIWGVAFASYNNESRADAWLAHRNARTSLLVIGCLAYLITVLPLSLRYFLPGRILSGVVIGMIAAALCIPATSMAPKQRFEMVRRDRFVGFKETTRRYVAFSGSILIACMIASRRSANSTS
jgi:hypothetical protein